MNVLHVNEQRGWRGGEQQAAYLIRGLARAGHTVFIAGRKNAPFLQSDHGDVPLHRIAAPFLGEFDLITAAILARTIRKYRIDIVHAHSSHAHTAACLARTIARRGKVVVSRRVDFPPRNGWLNRWKYEQPDRIIAVSGYIAEIMRQYGIDETRLAVVHSGTDPGRFNVAPAARAELGVPDAVPLLGNVAALVGHKDHETLLNAMPMVQHEIPDLHLVLVGEGPLRPAIERRIVQLGITERVRLLGHRSDVPRVLRALDAFVLSSKEEGFGGAALEAMAAGLPVVSTAAGGMPETVEHEKTGLLVPIRQPVALAAAVIRIFRDAALVRALKANLPVQVARFSVDRMVAGNLEVYRQLLADYH